MSINLIRVVNQQTIRRSILLDKLDDGQANTEGYAYKHLKQQVYVPFANPLNPVVKGYTDLVPTDRVLLSVDRGTIKGLVDAGKVLAFVYSSALKAAPIITAVAHVGTDTTIDGTTFLSVTPDITYVIINNGVTTQKIPSSAFSVHTAVQIVIPDAAITIGVPAETWTVTVEANCQNSNVRPIRAIPVITNAVLGAGGEVTITGVDFTSNLPATSSVHFAAPAIDLTRADILAAGGTFTDVSIVVPAALAPAVAETTTTVAVEAEGWIGAAVPLIMTPTITRVRLNSPTVGDVTITGAHFLSNVGDSSVAFDTPLGLTQTEITTGGGVFTDVSIVIPAVLAVGVVESNAVTVTADSLTSAQSFVVATPVISSALVNVPGAGDLTIAGTGFVSIVPTNTSATITGTGAIVLDQATITGGGGTVIDTAIVIPAALFTNGAIAAVTSSVKVTADFLDSGVVVVA